MSTRWYRMFAAEFMVSESASESASSSRQCDMCDEADNDYCPKCGTPHGTMRELVEGEWSDQLDSMYVG